MMFLSRLFSIRRAPFSPLFSTCGNQLTAVQIGTRFVRHRSTSLNMVGIVGARIPSRHCLSRDQATFKKPSPARWRDNYSCSFLNGTVLDGVMNGAYRSRASTVRPSAHTAIPFHAIWSWGHIFFRLSAKRICPLKGTCRILPAAW